MLERLLIVGLGSIGKRHARLARQLYPGCKITALRHKGCPEIAEPGIDHCVTSLDEALQFNPQVAVIANPASRHVEIALPLAKAGVHLLVEKPISNTAQGVSELIAVCRAHRIVLMAAYNMRFLPSLQRFRQLVLDRRVGRVLSVRAEVGQFLPSWRPGSDYRNNVSAQAKLGGGVLLELSHEIDYLRWIFGEVEWVNATLRKQSGLEIDVEDTAHLILGFRGVSENIPVIASLDVDFVRHDTARSCTAIGEAGSLRWNALEGKVELYEQGGNTWQVLDAFNVVRDESYLAEWKHFLACIEAETSPMICGEDGLAVLKIVDAARNSSAGGVVVKIQ